MTYNTSIETDGNYHTIYSILKNVSGTRKHYIYLDGTLLGGPTTLTGPTSMTNRTFIAVGDGYVYSGEPTDYDFEFGEIKDLYIYDTAYYPGSTAPSGWT